MDGATKIRPPRADSTTGSTSHSQCENVGSTPTPSTKATMTGRRLFIPGLCISLALFCGIMGFGEQVPSGLETLALKALTLVYLMTAIVHFALSPRIP